MIPLTPISSVPIKPPYPTKPCPQRPRPAYPKMPCPPRPVGARPAYPKMPCPPRPVSPTGFTNINDAVNKELLAMSVKKVTNKEVSGKDPMKGDLIYGVASDDGRNLYLERNSKFSGMVDCIDQYKIVKSDNKSSAKDAESFVNFITKHSKYSSAVGSLGSNEDLRRKCKAGIEWAVSQNRKVHFILDGLNLDSVPLKNYTGETADNDKDDHNFPEKERSVTGSELRYIYRNRDDENIKKNVIFWNKGEQVKAPWDSDEVKVGVRNPCTEVRESKVFVKEGWDKYRHTNS